LALSLPAGLHYPDLPYRLAPEGSGNLAAAFLKNLCAQHDEEPQGGEEGQGTKHCSHHVQASFETEQCSLFVPLCQDVLAGGHQSLETTGDFD
jgi:hypothetical protein